MLLPRLQTLLLRPLPSAVGSHSAGTQQQGLSAGMVLLLGLSKGQCCLVLCWRSYVTLQQEAWHQLAAQDYLLQQLRMRLLLLPWLQVGAPGLIAC